MFEGLVDFVVRVFYLHSPPVTGIELGPGGKLRFPQLDVVLSIRDDLKLRPY